MKLQDISEAKYAGQNIDDLLQHIYKITGTFYGYDYTDEKEDEVEFEPSDIIWKDDGGIMFTMGESCDQTTDDELDPLFNKAGFKEPEDYVWYTAHGDDIPNGLLVKNEQMIFNQTILEEILDITGPNCYSER